MKKAIQLILVFIVATSCSDSFTEIAPSSNRNGAAFYRNANDFVFGINASYAGLQNNGVYGRAYWTMFEMRSDNTDQGPDQTGLARQFTEINAFTENSLTEQMDLAWSDSYRVIANSNVILERIDAVDIDETLKKRIIGEALFLRSLMYYHLAIAFGNIPLQLTSFIPGDELQQVDANTVYQQLIQDLRIAEENLAISNTEVGRATKGAAATLLAKVLLTIGNNSEAEVVLRRIIANYGYRLLDNYSDLWGASNENNAESIFEVQFISGGIGQGSAFSNDFSPSPDLQTGQGFARNRPTISLTESFLSEDLRFEPSMGTSYINGEGETISARFIRKFQSNPPTENDADINFVVFRYADVLLMLAEALGESPESYALINQVRTRAGLANIDGSTPGTFAEKLLNERRLELAFENHRWPDLLRFGVAAQKVNEAEPAIAQSSVRTLFFIPQREMDINPNFVQN
ncbi:RagB/SusD family nutrient uptake outer membrane protein [Arenibacter sp. GZD96]|uniref:RagB/SusD family nutrient uptake outer membrane protein n=1 Tax=Aurantibrevibacter litoralis TaxID=3106030 RepID=UPI002AFFCBF5|nr:RagB/SusD family nutrient uptake outer membrane protein [Arenibacter sp. GZD-96]MEA1786166.1 RagB/SusD family nutrient uptake outer membrane protein [Arenibacter sp. GZD-96]